LKRERAKIETRLFKLFKKDDLKGAKGARGIADLKEYRHPQIKDPTKFWAYLIRKKAFDLLQKRIASRAYQDRLEAGERVPGVEIYTRHKINVKKLRQ
jgi:hypothetical protein